MADLVFAFCCTRFKERVFISHKRTRSLLKQFAKSGVSSAEFAELLDLLGCNATSLADLIQFLDCKQGMFDTYKCPVEWSAFLSALASASPVCGLLHPSEKAINLLTKMKTTCISHCPTDMECLQQELPVLFELIRSKTFPQRLLSPIIEDLIEKSTAPFKTEVKADMSLSETSTAQELSFFPSLKVHRKRRIYPADGSSGSQAVCTKKSQRHPSLLPGIFTLYCQHGKIGIDYPIMNIIVLTGEEFLSFSGICYGFQVMTVNESPNTPFTILYERFEKGMLASLYLLQLRYIAMASLSTAPSTAIYDNACNFHGYCLNREPKFFESTWFLVDRFHWANHTGKV